MQKDVPNWRSPIWNILQHDPYKWIEIAVKKSVESPSQIEEQWRS
jgi:hypothetical protein